MDQSATKDSELTERIISEIEQMSEEAGLCLADAFTGDVEAVCLNAKPFESTEFSSCTA